MFNLTKQERLVLTALAAIFLFGTVLHHTFKINPRLSSFLEIIDSEFLYPKTDINKASEEELVKIPCIGPALAKRIIEYRGENGPFKTLAQLKSVPGISEFKYRAIVKFLKDLPAAKQP